MKNEKPLFLKRLKDKEEKLKNEQGTSEEVDKKWLRQYDEVSKTVRRVMFALLGYCLFCLLTLGAPDVRLVAEAADIKIPIANTPVPYLGFLIVGPLILLGLMIYLHVFVGIAYKLNKERSDNALPFLFNLSGWVPIALSEFFFYWLAPIVLLVFVYKAWPRYFESSALLFCTGVAIALLLFLRIKRTNYLHSDSLLIGGISVFVAIALVVISSTLISEHRRVDLSGEDLSGVVFPRMRLDNANLVGTVLRGAVLKNAQLQRADLSNAQLQKADLSNAQLQGAVLENAQLQKTDLTNAQLHEAVLRNVQLQGTTLKSPALHGADLRGAQLQGAVLENAQLQGANLENSQLQWAKLENAQLQGAVLVSAQLQWAELKKPQLQGAVLTDAQLQGALVLDADVGKLIMEEVSSILKSLNVDDELYKNIEEKLNDRVGMTLQDLNRNDAVFCETREKCDYSNIVTAIVRSGCKDNKNIKDLIAKYWFLFNGKKENYIKYARSIPSEVDKYCGSDRALIMTIQDAFREAPKLMSRE